MHVCYTINRNPTASDGLEQGEGFKAAGPTDENVLVYRVPYIYSLLFNQSQIKSFFSSSVCFHPLSFELMNHFSHFIASPPKRPGFIFQTLSCWSGMSHRKIQGLERISATETFPSTPGELVTAMTD